MHQGRRWRMPVDDFALAGGATDTIASKQTAEHVWEPKFLAEIMAGRDPRIAPSVPKTAVGVTVADFLDLYFTNYVEAQGLRDPVTVNGRLKAIKARRPARQLVGEAARRPAVQSHLPKRSGDLRPSRP